MCLVKYLYKAYCKTWKSELHYVANTFNNFCGPLYTHV